MIALRLGKSSEYAKDASFRIITKDYAKKQIAEALAKNPNVEIEVFDLVPSSALQPTTTDRIKAREKAVYKSRKLEMEAEGRKVAENRRRLEAIEEEAANLRLRLGLS